MSSSSRYAAPIRKFKDMDGKKVKPGDLIEIFRPGYQHWGVYVGDGNIVHFVTPGEGSGSRGFTVVGDGKVLKEKLEDVAEEGKWRVNNLLDDEYTSHSANGIVKEACSMVDTELNYNLLKYNCQHFATEMRYGKPESRQVKIAVAAIVGSLALFAATLGTFVGIGDKIRKDRSKKKSENWSSRSSSSRISSSFSSRRSSHSSLVESNVGRQALKTKSK